MQYYSASPTKTRVALLINNIMTVYIHIYIYIYILSKVFPLRVPVCVLPKSCITNIQHHNYTYIHIYLYTLPRCFRKEFVCVLY